MGARLSPRSMPRGNDVTICVFQLCSSAEVIIAGAQIFKTAASRFVSEEEINLMKENAVPRNTKHATKFGMTLFKGKMWKLC